MHTIRVDVVLLLHRRFRVRGEWCTNKSTAKMAGHTMSRRWWTGPARHIKVS